MTRYKADKPLPAYAADSFCILETHSTRHISRLRNTKSRSFENNLMLTLSTI